nr:MAG TPA: hypothetical protein [Caudoviricetes sp.]
MLIIENIRRLVNRLEKINQIIFGGEYIDLHTY